MTKTEQGEMIFVPQFVQKSHGPHLAEFVYATDSEWDAFHSNIAVTREGVKVSDTEGREKFGINVRWNVEGFGWLFMTADNGGEFYRLPAAGTTERRNLNFELANSRVVRNRKRFDRHQKAGWMPSRAVRGFVDLSEGFLDDAKHAGSEEARGALAQQSLLYALWAGEKIELEKAQSDILRNGYRPDFFIGCDARGFFQMHAGKFLDLFSEIFNYATITHYLLAGVFEDFEEVEGKKQFDLRTALFHKLKEKNIAIEGRPLWWSYKTTTPDWLRYKPFDKIKLYLERHVREVVGHYGDGMYAWEVVNEFHDWANECKLNPDQITELCRLACDTARDTAPNVHRLINNCAPFGDYVQMKKMHEIDAFYPQRTPFQYLKQLVEAGVDFDITGVQMYFPDRDLADTYVLLEKFSTLGKPIQLTEVGASSGPSYDSVVDGRLEIAQKPYPWHRRWDEELQADWMEGMYSLAYSKPYIEAINWYDFVDPHSWIPNGGFLRSPEGEKRAIFNRLLTLQQQWKALGKK